MKSRNLKLVGILALLVAFTFTMAACDMGDTGVEAPEDEVHGVRVNIGVSEDDVIVEPSGDADVLTIEDPDHLTVTQVVVKLVDGDTEYTETIDDPDSLKEAEFNYEVVFEEVDSGDYEINAEIKGTLRDGTDRAEDEKIRYKGETENVPVLPDEIVEESVDVTPLDWDSLDITLKEHEDDEDGVLDRVDKILLEHPALEDDFEEGFTVNDDDRKGTVNFEEGRIPARWHLAIKFTDEVSNVNYVDRDDDWIEILLLPNEEKEIELTVKEIGGEVTVDVDVHQSPDTPKNLRVEEGYLRWDEVTDADYYQVLMDDSGYNDYLKPVETIDAEEDPKFRLLGEESGDYYVRAYKEEYSSDVQEESVEVVQDDTEGAYSSADGVVYDTIGDALDSFDNPPADPYILAAGTFDENILIDIEDLTLESVDGAESTTIKAEDDDVDTGIGVVGILANNVTVDGFTIDNLESNNHRGIRTARYEGTTIKNNIFVNALRGVQGDLSEGDYSRKDLTIQNNTFKTDFGVAGTENMEGLLIVDNTFDTPEEAIGLGDGVEIVDEDGVVQEPFGDVIFLEDENDFINDGGVVDYRGSVYNQTQKTFHDTIRGAIDLAEDEDTIEVAAGTYDEGGEQLVIDIPGLTLKSLEGAEETIIEPTMRLDSSLGDKPALIEGFTIGTEPTDTKRDIYYSLIVRRSHEEWVKVRKNIIETETGAVYVEGDNMKLDFKNNKVLGPGFGVNQMRSRDPQLKFSSNDFIEVSTGVIVGGLGEEIDYEDGDFEATYNNFENSGTAFLIGELVEESDLYKITSNNFDVNDYGVNNTSEVTFDATNNWWGTEDIEDIKDLIEGDVNWYPHEESEVTDAGADW